MIIQLGRQYEKAGVPGYSINHIFKATDVISPGHYTLNDPQNGEEQMQIDSASKNKNLQIQIKQSRIGGQRKASSNSSKSNISTEPSNNSGAITPMSGMGLAAENFNSINSGGDSGDRQKEQTNFTQLMHERWNRLNSEIPLLDQKDIIEDSPIFNFNKKTGPEHQHHPEFTQQCYLRLRSQEEVFVMNNYLDLSNSPPKSEKISLAQKISNTFKPKQNMDQVITNYDRSYGVQKIFDLHQKKEYKVETLFVAAGILDRYINMIGVLNFPKTLMVNLATISVLMSAKLEQPISPSFSRMINLLTDEEKKHVTKQSLIDLEAQILIKLGFDFNFPGPIQPMERFLRILNYDLNEIVYDMSFQICKFQLNDSKFLNYRPSQIAACSCILSINIYEKDLKRTNNQNTFFKDCKTRNGLVEMNTMVWNNEHVHTLSLYSIDEIKGCLHELAMFICNNLQPNRLEGFDIESVLELQQYQPQNANAVANGF